MSPTEVNHKFYKKILSAATKPKRFEVAKQYANQPTLSDSVIASMNLAS